jgi:hypothetical protein
MTHYDAKLVSAFPLHILLVENSIQIISCIIKCLHTVIRLCNYGVVVSHTCASEGGWVSSHALML